MSEAPPAEDAQLRLASQRTMLAVERTWAAWIRTGLAALASGVAARQFAALPIPRIVAELMASLLILFSGLCFLAGVWRKRGHPTAATSGKALAPAPVLVAASAVMALISATALASLWIGPR